MSTTWASMATVAEMLRPLRVFSGVYVGVPEYRRVRVFVPEYGQEIVQDSSPVRDLLERWPALFDVIQDAGVDNRREVVIHGLMVYLSENAEHLEAHYQHTNGNLDPDDLKYQRELCRWQSFRGRDRFGGGTVSVPAALLVAGYLQTASSLLTLLHFACSGDGCSVLDSRAVLF
ncbi:hypothetical protein AOLI_G00099200 [Acnodon oligacanthus]